MFVTAISNPLLNIAATWVAPLGFISYVMLGLLMYPHTLFFYFDTYRFDLKREEQKLVPMC